MVRLRDRVPNTSTSIGQMPRSSSPSGTECTLAWVRRWLEARAVLEELSAHPSSLCLIPGQSLRFQPNTTFRGPLSRGGLDGVADGHQLVEWDVSTVAQSEPPGVTRTEPLRVAHQDRWRSRQRRQPNESSIAGADAMARLACRLNAR
jgi:hypothetical protein